MHSSFHRQLKCLLCLFLFCSQHLSTVCHRTAFRIKLQRHITAAWVRGNSITSGPQYSSSFCGQTQIIKCRFTLFDCTGATQRLRWQIEHSLSLTLLWFKARCHVQTRLWGIGPIRALITPFTGALHRSGSELGTAQDICAAADVCGGGVLGRGETITTLISHPGSLWDGKWLLAGLSHWL